MIDFAALTNVSAEAQQPARTLDVGCGTGLWLQQLLTRIPTLAASGVDGSGEMLAEARIALQSWPNVSLRQIDLKRAGWAQELDVADGFALIASTNLLHDIPDPATLLAELRPLLTPTGQLVLEDFAPRRPAWLWRTFEIGLQRIEQAPVRALTLAEAVGICEQAGFSIHEQKSFAVDWLWHGWALRASHTDSSSTKL